VSGWAARARQVIAEVHRLLPENATLAERTKAVADAYPFGPRQYWPYKAWCKARREYLGRYSYKARNAPPTPMEVFLASHPRDPASGRPVIS
jgi:hypothetical protein